MHVIHSKTLDFTTPFDTSHTPTQYSLCSKCPQDRVLANDRCSMLHNAKLLGGFPVNPTLFTLLILVFWQKSYYIL